MFKAINQKDLTQLKELTRYMKETNTNIIQVSEDVSDVIGKEITSTDIKLSLNRVKNMNLKEDDVLIIEALLELLYSKGFIEKPLHMIDVEAGEYDLNRTQHQEVEDVPPEEFLQDMVAEAIGQDSAKVDFLETEDCVDSPISKEGIEHEQTSNQYRSFGDKEEFKGFIEKQKEQSAKSVKFEESPGQQTQTAVKKEGTSKGERTGLCLSVIFGVFLFAGYLYNDMQGKQIQGEAELVACKGEVISQEERRTRLVAEIQEKIERVENLEGRLKKLREDVVQKEVKENSAQTQVVSPRDIIEPKTTPVPQKEDIGELDREEFEKLQDRLRKYKAEWRRDEFVAQLQKEKLQKDIRGALIKDEKKALLQKRYDLYRSNSRLEGPMAPYIVDEELKKQFLSSCFEYYEFRKTEYKEYCMCISNTVVKNKMDFLDANTLLLKHKLKTSYPNFSYIGNGEAENLNLLEYGLEKESKSCYLEHIKTKKTKNYKLNY